MTLAVGDADPVARGRLASHRAQHGDDDGCSEPLQRSIGARSPVATARGVTLVELMVVLFVLGIAATTVVLTAPSGEDGFVREADRLAARLQRAREEAVLGGHAVQVRVTSDGYAFAQQDFEAWRPLHDGPFRPVRFAEGTHARMPAGTRQARISFHFDPTGGSQAQEVVLERLDQRLRIAIDGSGEVSVDDLR
jgi:general secretion pathway protein H